MSLNEQHLSWLKRSSWTLFEASMILSGINPNTCVEKTPKNLESSEFCNFNNEHYAACNIAPQEETGYSYNSGLEDWMWLVGDYYNTLHLLVDCDNWGEVNSPKSWITRGLAQNIEIKWLPVARKNLDEHYFYGNFSALPAEDDVLGSDAANLLKEIFDKEHSRHSLKLTAAILAWKEVTTGGKSSPKKAILAWLDDKYPTPTLSKDAKEMIAKVVNWNSTGGAPRSE